MIALDHIDAEAFSPLGDCPLAMIDLSDAGAGARAAMLKADTRAIVVGVDRAGTLPAVVADRFDCLLTTAQVAPRPWVAVPAARLDARIGQFAALVAAAPHAASVLVSVLRIGETLSFEAALEIESLGYSTLLGGEAFRAWRGGVRSAGAPCETAPFVALSRTDDLLTITLARPGARNPICAGMRDALWEALASALDDPSEPRVLLRGDGACFSTGGDLAEFGTAGDLAQAHSIRTARSCALLLHQLGSRAEVLLHGACVGSGIEIPTAAARRRARPDTFVQLPELRMGLIPGAGGTVTLSRAIGRHRTAYLVLTGKRVAAPVLADWGLVELEA